MKKLGLIIPLLFIPFFLLATDGVDGCHIVTGPTMQSRLYHTPYTAGSGSPTEWIQTGPSGAGFNVITPTKCFENSGIACKVYDFGTTGTTPPSSAVIYTGYYALVTTNCPIDDYLPLLFIFTAGIAFFQVRKKHSIIKDENFHHYRSL